MCRIVGVITKDNSIDVQAKLNAMLRSVAHGGPDDEGKYFDGTIAFGHRRLSIIDLTPAGHQPMATAGWDVVVSFNGEIFNYLQLRAELEKMGAVFRTRTDTEVILMAYQHWGVSSFNRLEGMFAFSIYDKRKQKVILVRDHIGVKPLYYSVENDTMIFASEVRAFKAYDPAWNEHPDWRILFLALGSLPYPFTTLDRVYQLAQGSYLEFDVDSGSANVTNYVKLHESKELIANDHVFLKMIRRSIFDAVKKNLISDAPLGIFLSGGIDSSLLALIADQTLPHVRTISVNFSEAKFDEGPYQKLVLETGRSMKHVSQTLTEDALWSQLDDIWNAMDQPSIDGVNSYFVCKCAKSQGLKVVLSGLGADEIFGGYESFNRVRWMGVLRRVPFKRAITKLITLKNRAWNRLMFLKIKGVIGDYLFLRGIHTPDNIAKILNVPEKRVWNVLNNLEVTVPPTSDKRAYASLLETNIYMSNQLLKDTDYMSMWHGVEVRVPFLDIRLLEDVQRIEPEKRFKKGWPKYLLTASTNNILPHEVVFRSKRGFTFPFSKWLIDNLGEFETMLPKTEQSGKMMEDFRKGRIHWSRCWSLAVVHQFRH
jgi:asparagine synthase (glutamine-hydrolysing)